MHTDNLVTVALSAGAHDLGLVCCLRRLEQLKNPLEQPHLLLLYRSKRVCHTSHNSQSCKQSGASSPPLSQARAADLLWRQCKPTASIFCMSQKVNNSNTHKTIYPELPTSYQEPQHSYSNAAASKGAHNLAQFSRRFSQGLNYFGRRPSESTSELSEQLEFSDPEERDDDEGATSSERASAGNGLSVEGPDAILAAHWSSFKGSKQEDVRRLLTLIFRDGVQVWDASQLAAIRELGFVRPQAGSDVACAQLLHEPVNSSVGSSQQQKPSAAWDHGQLLAYACTSHRKNTPVTILYIFSLHHHRIIKEVLVRGHIVQLHVNSHHILLSCISPPVLHVVSNASLSADPMSPITDLAVHPQTGHPVVSLGSRRLLAYASSSALPEQADNGVVPASGWEHDSGTTPAEDHSSASPSSDLARKVSQSALHGVQAIGDYGLQYWSASKSPPHVASAASQSKSAPTVAGTFGQTHSPASRTPMTVKVVDLQRNQAVAHFRPSTGTNKPISALSLNPSGSLILVATSYAHAFHVFQLRPGGVWNKDPMSTGSPDPVWHRYRLNRGLTPAEARQVDWSQDSKYVTVYTSHGTSHIFAIRPVGGLPKYPRHLADGVDNSQSIEPLSVAVRQTARIRGPSAVGAPQRSVAPAVACWEVSSTDIDGLARSANPAIKEKVHSLQGLYKPFVVMRPHTGALELFLLSSSQANSQSSASHPGLSGVSAMLERYAGAVATSLDNSSSPPRAAMAVKWQLTGSREDNPFTSVQGPTVVAPARTPRAEDSRRWSAQAEVRTFSTSRNVVPRTVYLSPSFVFYAYNRKFEWRNGTFRPPSRRVEVRREVQFSNGGSSDPSDASAVSEPIHIAMGDKLGLQPTSATSVSPNYLAPAALNGVPGKSRSGQYWPVKAVAPHLEYVQDGLNHMRRGYATRRGFGRGVQQSEPGEPLSLSFEDRSDTMLLAEGRVPGSEEDVPSLGITSGSSSTRNTSEDAWSHWDQPSSPDSPAPLERQDCHVEPFVLDEDFSPPTQDNQERPMDPDVARSDGMQGDIPSLPEPLTDFDQPQAQTKLPPVTPATKKSAKARKKARGGATSYD